MNDWAGLTSAPPFLVTIERRGTAYWEGARSMQICGSRLAS